MSKRFSVVINGELVEAQGKPKMKIYKKMLQLQGMIGDKDNLLASPETLDLGFELVAEALAIPGITAADIENGVDADQLEVMFADAVAWITGAIASVKMGEQ